MSLESVLRAAMPGVTAEHLAATVDAVRAEVTPPAPSNQPTPQVGDVWRYVGNDPFTGTGAIARVVAVGHLDTQGWPLVRAEVEHGSDGRGVEGRRVANWVKWWRLIERGGRPWPPEQEPATDERPEVEPATDEQIEAWDGWPLTTHRASMVIARVRQEKAWRLAETESATISALSEAAMGERLRTAERERDEAVARAEAAEQRADGLKATRDYFEVCRDDAYERVRQAEAEVARMRPVVEAAVDWDMGLVDLDDLVVALDEYRHEQRRLNDYRAARKEDARG